MKKIISLISFILILGYNLKLKAQNCTVNAGVEKIQCVSSEDTLRGNASGLFQTNPIWLYIGNEKIDILNDSKLTSKFTGMERGKTYTFKLSATCEDGSKVYDIVKYTFAQLPSKPFAGVDTSLCQVNGTEVKLSANKADSGEVGSWSVGGGKSGNFSDLKSPNATFKTSVNSCTNISAYTLRWTISNGLCALSDDLTINYLGGQLVNAGVDQEIRCIAQTKMDASCPGDGVDAGTWSMIDGPSILYFESIHKYNSMVYGLKVGKYILKWTVNSSCVSGSDTMVMNVISIVPPTTARTGGSLIYCYRNIPAKIYLSGNKHDADETAKWVQVSGPKLNIANDTAAVTLVSGISKKGEYKFAYKIVRGECESSSTMTITIEGDTVINGGNDYVLNCNVSEITLNPPTKNGVWSFMKGPVNPSISGSRLYNMTIAGTYTYLYTYYNSCGKYYDTIQITTSFSPTKSNAGTDQSFACNVTTGYLAANKPQVGNGKWTQVTGPTFVTFSDEYNPSTKISNLSEGMYLLRWSIEAGPKSIPSSDEITVYITKSKPSLSSAGEDQFLGYNTPVYLKGNKPVKNEFGEWKLISGKHISISDSTSPDAVISGTEANATYTFTWKVYNACGENYDTVVIRTGSHQGPSAANACENICLPKGTKRVLLYAAKPTFGLGFWSQLNGPSKAVIDDTLSIVAEVTSLTDGNYIFTWNVMDSLNQKNIDTVLVTISAQVTIADANIDQTICDYVTTLVGNKPAIGKGTWSLAYGMGNIHISNSEASITNVENLDSGIYIFRYTINNGACASSFDEMKVTVLKKPVVAFAGEDIEGYNLDSVQLNGNNPSMGTGKWIVYKAEQGKPIISDIYNRNAVIRGLKPGITQLIWSISGNSICKGTFDTVQLTYLLHAYRTFKHTICENTRTILSMNDSSQVAGCWELLSSPPIPSSAMTSQKPIQKLYNKVLQFTGIQLGVYVYRYTYYSNCSVKLFSLDTIVVVPIAKANAGIDKNINRNQGDTMVLEGNSAYNSKGHWIQLSGPKVKIENPDSNISMVLYTELGRYTFRWELSNGSCSTIDDVMFKVDGNVNNKPTSDTVIKKVVDVFVPNAFTPDANGLNDYFSPIAYDTINYVIQIFNRWGELVYSGNQEMKGWDGTYKSTECPSETYMWVMSYVNKDENGWEDGKTLSGQVTLLR